MRLVAHMAVEIAVRAFDRAERPVHIDAKAGVAGRVVEHAPDVSRASGFGKRVGRPGGEIGGGLDGHPAARRHPRPRLRRLGAMAPEDFKPVMRAAPVRWPRRPLPHRLPAKHGPADATLARPLRQAGLPPRQPQGGADRGGAALHRRARPRRLHACRRREALRGLAGGAVPPFQRPRGARRRGRRPRLRPARRAPRPGAARPGHAGRALHPHGRGLPRLRRGGAGLLCRDVLAARRRRGGAAAALGSAARRGEAPRAPSRSSSTP